MKQRIHRWGIALCVTLLPWSLGAQVKIGPAPGSPDASAMLEVESNHKGLLLPRLTTAQMQAIANAAKGLLVFNTTDSVFYMHLDTGWTRLATGTNMWAVNGSHAYSSNSGHVGIGTATPTSKLHLAGNMRLDGNLNLPNSTPTTGVIYKEGIPFLHNAGLVVQQNVYLGTGAGSFHTLAKKNVAIGSYALANSDGADNIAIGFRAAFALTGGSSYTESYKNLFVGYLCGENATGGINNVSMGNEAGYNLQAGSSGNILIGSDAGHDLTTGIGNVLVGNNVRTTTGYLNTGIGGNSGVAMKAGSYNTWMGSDALKSNKNGLYNVAVGSLAAAADTNGSYNVYVGAFAGNNTQGSNNVFIGPFAGSADGGAMGYRLIIHNNPTQLHLINGDFFSYKVGIKKTLADLAYTLDVGGEIRIGSLPSAPAAANGLMYYNSTDQKMKTYENGTWKNTVYDNTLKTKAGDPTVADLPDGSFHVWKNTTSGNVYLWVNDGGTLKKVQLN
jgi:trimeric autotransporter adhesin